ncbi:hypothetical protein [Anaeromyxobacter dehalogenans]|uniref:hypothetical protein n=1 Tax=Anaeromyxobacter dehalogenans TaxID=161493 RepID=UPI0002FEC23B|nr:hypothetical protein [Anaeromyxobacter dehalogenans]
MLTWIGVPDGREGVLDALLSRLPIQGFERRTQACTVEGLAATCRVLRNATGKPPTVVGAEQVVRGTRLVVTCVSFREGTEVSEICRPVLSLSAPAPAAAEPAAPAAR